MLALPVPIPDEEKKVKCLFSVFWGASKGFMKALKEKCENKNLFLLKFVYLLLLKLLSIWIKLQQLF